MINLENLTTEEKVALAKKLKEAEKTKGELEALKTELEAIKALYLADRDPEVIKEVMTSFLMIEKKLNTLDETLKSLAPKEEIKISNFPDYPAEMKITNPVKSVEILNPVKEVKVNNLKDLKIPPFPKKIETEDKKTAKTLTEVLSSIKALLKAQKPQDGVKILNREPVEAIPVVLTEVNRKSFYTAMVQAFGAAVASIFQLKNKAGEVINPAIEEKQQLFLNEAYDYVSVAYPQDDTEIYTFKTGGVGGSIVTVVTLVYTDNTKVNLSTVTKS